MMSMVGNMSDIKPAMSDEDLMGGDEETVMIIAVFQVIFSVLLFLKRIHFNCFTIVRN